MIADFPAVKVMYLKSDRGIAGSEATFSKLEAKLSSLKGRKFFGLVFGTPPNEEYWACVEITTGDDPTTLGLQIWTIPAGKYAQEKIQNWSKHISEIGLTFKKLADRHDQDLTRPSIEFYRSMKELLLRLPIKN